MDKFDELKDFFEQQKNDILAEYEKSQSQELRRFKCVVAYDGTDFCGWQSQLGGGSIQDFIEFKLSSILGKPTRIHGSGRTDAGVHANGQVFHFDAIWKHSPEAMARALCAGNVQVVRVLSVEEVSDDFHARFSVEGKRYVYKISKGYAMPDLARYRWSLGNRKTDVEKMISASKIFLGTHDFKAYSANRGANVKENTVKTIYRLDVEDLGNEIRITTEGSGYLYKMVRLLVGALVQCAQGKLSESDLQKALESKTRGNIFQAAPAVGLTLDKVFYDKNQITISDNFPTPAK